MSLWKNNNTWYKLSLLLVILVCFIAFSASAQNSLQAKAESLFKQHKAPQSLGLYNKLVKKNPNDVSALWHSSLLYSRLGSQLISDKKEKKYYTMAKKRAMRALNHHPKSSMANYAMAVALGRLATIFDNLEKKIVASRKIKKFAVHALKIDAANAGAWNVLSRWNYGFANMDPNKRAAARIFLGEMVKGTSYKKAVKYGKKAIKFNPSMVAYYRDLAKAYKGMGQDEKAVKTCREALKKNPVWPEGKAANKECGNLITNLSDK